MAFSFQDMVEEARLSARALIDYGEHFFNPTVRLGVTGLSVTGLGARLAGPPGGWAWPA